MHTLSLHDALPIYIELCLIYAFIKLVNINTTHKKINIYLNKAKIEIDKLIILYNNEYKKIKKTYTNYTNDTINLITKYKLYTSLSKKLFNILYYKSKNKNNIIKYALNSSYFAIESYYTPCTINVVVNNMQGKLNFKLSKINYICSIIENLGYLIEHLNKEEKKKDNIKNIILKNSKYIYRIYYSIGYALNNANIKNYAKKIYNEIILHRDTSNIDTIDFNLILYNNKITLKEYVYKIQIEILDYIEELL